MSKIKNKIFLSIILLLHINYIYEIYKYIKQKNSTTFSQSIDPLKVNKDYFYFIQITDTHLSRRFTNKQDKNFINFLDEISKMNYQFVVHTGDIFDSQDEFIGVKKENYFKYLKLIKNKRIFSIRGNHDIFKSNEVLNKEIERMIYQTDRTNRNILVESGGKKTLIRLLDGTPKNGAPKFYNFFGVLEDDYYKITNDLCINMCHYPMNVIKLFNPKYSECNAWFSGHFHSFFKYGNIHKNEGKLESVLKDFYSNNIYRMIGVYKGNLSFNDVFLKKPKLLILNPTDKNLGIKQTEERVLKFLAFDFEELEVKINDKTYNQFEKEDEYFVMNLPKKARKIKVIAKNKYGESFHEVDIEEGSQLSPFPLKIPFFYLPFLLCFCYFIFVFFIFIYFEKFFLIFYLRNLYNFLLPTFLLKAHGNSFEIFTSTKAGQSNTFDIFYFHLVFSGSFDLILLLALHFEIPLIFILFHMVVFILFFKYCGMHFRPLENFTVLFFVFYFFFKKFKNKSK